MSVAEQSERRQHHFTAEEYLRLELDPDVRTELIDGVIYDMSPLGGPHNKFVVRLIAYHALNIGEERAAAFSQGDLITHSDYVPMPDFVLTKPRTSDETPHVDEVILVVEVSETTLSFDLNVKLPRYAKQDVPEVWVVDLEGRRVIVFRDPQGDQYQTRIELDEKGVIAPQLLPDSEFDFSKLFSKKAQE